MEKILIDQMNGTAFLLAQIDSKDIYESDYILSQHYEKAEGINHLRSILNPSLDLPRKNIQNYSNFKGP